MSEQPPTAVELADSILRTYESVERHGKASQAFSEETEREIRALWQTIAELRDEINGGLGALSNRLEAQRVPFNGLLRDVSGDDAS